MGVKAVYEHMKALVFLNLKLRGAQNVMRNHNPWNYWAGLAMF